MSQIFVQLDPKIKQSDIVIALTDSSPEESGDFYQKNQEGNQQTSLYGIATPLIQINNIAINFNNIINFQLNCTDTLPTISLIVYDTYGLIKLLDETGNDNELRIEILPAFDNAYKKINLTFYISTIRITGKNVIYLSGEYKLPKLISSNIRSFGEINTFDLFKQIATETGLGFASNIESNDLDKRFIYCDNKSYLELMNREIKYSGSEKQIFDYWVDYWNTLNYADIYERYNTIDKDDDLMIWIAGQKNQISEGVKVKPFQIIANLTNHPSMKDHELFVNKYNIVNNSGEALYKGTDKVFSIYEKNKQEYEDHLIQDGDIKNDIFAKYEYLGETYSDYNYLLMNQCREAYIQKMNSETLEVIVNSPMLSLMRGHKINFTNYFNDSVVDDKMKGINNSELAANDDNEYTVKDPTINPEDEEKILNGESNGRFIIDKKTSGQYLIIGSSIRYHSDHWETILTLVRPANQKTKQINFDL